MEVGGCHPPPSVKRRYFFFAFFLVAFFFIECLTSSPGIDRTGVLTHYFFFFLAAFFFATDQLTSFPSPAQFIRSVAHRLAPEMLRLIGAPAVVVERGPPRAEAET